MRALVTGGAGLIGSHIVDLLLDKGYQVRILDNLDPQTHPEGKPDWIPRDAEFVLGDMRSTEAVDSALEDVDIVFHEAAFGGFTTELSRYVDVNSSGTVKLFECLRGNRHRVQKMVVASSQALYGEGAYQCAAHGEQWPILRSTDQMRAGRWELECPRCKKPMAPILTREEKRADGETIYALTKQSQERWSLALGRQLGIPIVALRYAVTYGPRQSIFNPYTGVVSIFSTRILNGLPPVLYEDGLQTRDFIYAGDVARANLFVMENDDCNYQVYNVGTGVPTTVFQLASTLCQVYGGKVAPEAQGEFRPGDVRHIVHDVSKLAALGFRAQTSLTHGLERYALWIRTRGAVREYFTEALSGLRTLGIVMRTQGG